MIPTKNSKSFKKYAKVSKNVRIVPNPTIPINPPIHPIEKLISHLFAAASIILHKLSCGSRHEIPRNRRLIKTSLGVFKQLVLTKRIFPKPKASFLWTIGGRSEVFWGHPLVLVKNYQTLKIVIFFYQQKNISTWKNRYPLKSLSKIQKPSVQVKIRWKSNKK